MKNCLKYFVLAIIVIFLLGWSSGDKIRKPVDPVGYAIRASQMDSLM